MDWTWLIAYIACLTPSFAYYHRQSERVFSLSKNPGAIFGFSVSSTSSGPSAKLLVGAPLADLTGDVYICDLSNPSNICTATDRSPIKRFEDKVQYANQSYWYGATVMGTNDNFVACSPRLLNKEVELFERDPVGTFGRCLLHQDKSVSLLSTITGAKRKEQYKKFEQVMDSFGWSLIVDSDGTIVIGGPAMITGRMIKLEIGSISLSYINGGRVKNSFNFGYSVAYGKFLRTGDEISVAVGSTYGSFGKGRVTVFSKSLESYKQIEGPKVGIMFGASLCPAQLTTKGQASLLVGAPAYATSDTYNVGAVYVYETNGKKILLKRTIVGKESNSFFGFAIISLGDLDHDQIDEIAISAPYYKDRGAVYLYCGADIMSSEDPQPIQTIEPEDTIKTFGYSLSALRDYDENGCNELAIGAPDSNTVKVLRCIAGITIELMKFPSNIAGTNGLDKTETLDACIMAYFPDKPATVKADIVVHVAFEHEGVTGGGDVIIQIRSKKNEPYCAKVNLHMSGTKGNYNDKIKFTMSADLRNDPSKRSDFKGEDVILNKLSTLSLSGYIWAQECGNKKCVPKLSLAQTFSEKSPYQIGSSPSIMTRLLVHNTREVAYDACLRVMVLGASITRPPGSCTLLDTGNTAVSLLCKPRQLLRKGGPWQVDLSLDTTRLNNKDIKIAVNTSLYNECDLDLADSNYEEFDLYADAASIDVHGRTGGDGISNLVNLTKSDIAAQKSFEQVFTIINGGLTSWVNIPISVSVQKQDYIARSVKLDNQECTSDNATDTEVIKYSCVANKLDRDAGLDVKVRMHPVSTDLSDRISKDGVIIFSEIEVVLGDTYKFANVTTELKLAEGTVPIWIIVVASILALIILLIIFFILRECGLLERKNKKNLKAARMSVRRQTVIRQSMMNRPRSQDQRNLIVEDPSQANKKRKDRRVVVNDF